MGIKASPMTHECARHRAGDTKTKPSMSRALVIRRAAGDLALIGLAISQRGVELDKGVVRVNVNVEFLALALEVAAEEN